MLKQEGILAFWRGSLAPILGVGACVSIQFGFLEGAKRKVLKEKGKLDTLDFMHCGSVAGIANSFVSAPAEHFRIKMQVQGKVDPRGDPIYKSDADCIKTIYRNHGIKGIYKGFYATILRECGAYGTYFGGYEYIVHNFLIPEGGTKKDVKMWQLFLTGGISGYFFWVPWYPFDAIKSKIQADSLSNPRYKGFNHCLFETIRHEKFAGLYKGFVPCLLRAFPANGITFLTYELTMRLIS